MVASVRLPEAEVQFSNSIGMALTIPLQLILQGVPSDSKRILLRRVSRL